MGTNYYRRRIPTEDERKKLHERLDELMDGKIQNFEFRDSFDTLNEKVHICAMSYGWQVCFDHNWGKYYQPNRKDLERFLAEPDTVIEDEYGKRYTSGEFWETVRLHNSSEPNRWTAKTYREYEESRGNYYTSYREEDIRRCESMFGVQCHGELDFSVDGLRFAVFTDFC